MSKYERDNGQRPPMKHRAVVKIVFALAILLSSSIFYSSPYSGRFRSPIWYPIHPSNDHIAHCAHIQPISASTYTSRQSRLRDLLRKHNATAYIAEPGANSKYFTGVGSQEWRLSERPLLVAVTSGRELDDNEQGRAHVNVEPEVIVLAPKFEGTRARRLPIQARRVKFVEWPEEGNPYVALLSALNLVPSSSIQGISESDDERFGDTTIFVDPMIRKFIADGVEEAADPSVHVNVLSAPKDVRRLREQKQAEEIEVLRCANEATVLALRAARERMYIGMTESDARRLVEKELSAAGLDDAYALTLFGENAALPHGGGVDRVLTSSDMILVDCGGTLYGYKSDVTRTFILPGTGDIPSSYHTAWSAVRAAQDSVLEAASKEGALTGDVDAAARKTLREYRGATDGHGGGWDKWFTHRVGHGIGLEGHESPYLVGSSTDVILPGHTFSNEPGIYIEGQFGIRLEDVFVIGEDGKATLLTERVGGLAKSLTDL